MSDERGRVLGIGGIFFRSADHKSARRWYADRLGIGDGGEFASFSWHAPDSHAEHTTTWSVFPGDTKYFGPGGQQFMINYIVDDLDALLGKLEKQGVKIDPKRQNADYGKFAWIFDPDGNKIELWQPAG